MKTLFGLALVVVAVLLAPAALGCPVCADAAPAAVAGKGWGVWPIVGAFLVVPWAIGTVVVLVVRRELRRG